MSVSRLASAVCVVVTLISATAFAQPGGGRGPGGGPGGGRGPGGGGGGGLELLMREDVRKELEIVDSQYEELRGLGDEMRDEMREMFSGLRDLSQEERQEKFAELREKMAESREKIQDKVDDILLPHQRDRLKQLSVQSQMRRGTSAGLSSPAIVEELDISEEQLEKLREAAAKAQEELNEKVAKLREEAKEDILKVLTPSQRKKLEELTGEPYEFQNTWGRGGGERGGDRGCERGGRGGDRGGRPDA